MDITRNKTHELIMICIYDALTFVSLNQEFSVEQIMENIFNQEFSEIDLFSKEIVVKSLSHLDEIKNCFQKNMPKWTFSRLNVVEQSILIMTYTHKVYVEDVDKKILIDIAIKLSKKYLDKDDFKFVNAILDNVL